MFHSKSYPYTYTLHVQGMTCPHCEAKVSEALRQLPGVAHVRAHHQTDEVKVQAEEALDLSLLEERVRQAGYQVIHEA